MTATLAAPARLPVHVLGTDDGIPEAVHAVVQRAQNGDSSAVAELYGRYSNVVLRYVHYRMRDLETAEDIAHDVWVRALKNLPAYTWQGRDFGAWLVTISRNMITDHHKASHYRTTRPCGEPFVFEVEDIDPMVQPEALAVHSALRGLLLDALGSLTPDQRDCIMFRYYDGLSVGETARLMGRNECAVKALTTRAFTSLRGLLQAKGIRP